MKVAILTPTYNFSRFLPACLESVRGQGEDVRHYVADGGSLDATPQLLRRCLPESQFIIEDDSGQSEALNKALQLADADYVPDVIGWLNADEAYLPGAVRAGAAAIAAGADVAYGGSVFVTSGGEFVRAYSPPGYNRFALRNFGPYIHSCATFIRRSVLPQEPWDTELRRLMDWDLWLRLDRDGAAFKRLAAPLATFTVHDAQVTAQPGSCDSEEHRRIRRRYGLRFGLAAPRVSVEAARVVYRVKKLRDGAVRDERSWTAGFSSRLTGSPPQP